ncbi:uncharacterized protein LOC124335955 isoform X4 [Daphnia pulicaria]|uniref:uncharacterized protein LOC124335955 isoform X4 n=1 Tax=Daphnia pulicaria TaxID=35523 RepID=UPI001EEA81C0|nr:uncharacterized protein LOC124335955 isoform X4 [Daphnia pulicaria]
MGRQNLGCCLVALIVLQLALPALALPQMFNKFAEQGRKFAVKPNSNKKVITESNEIAPTEQQSNGGFQWSNILGMLIQMFLGGSSGGIDKADSGVNAVQLIQLISSLMDALKVSFSQRSSTARSLGSKDPFSDAAVAAVTIMKGYVDTHKTTDEVCMQRIMCDANNACARDAPDSGYLFCQLGTYAASYLLEKSTFTPLDAYTQAGRQGRTGESCAQIYSQCNEL